MRVVTCEYNALGGTVQIGLTLPRTADAQPILDILALALFRFEKMASRFIVTSELSRLNQRAGTKVSVSDQFKQLLCAAKK